MRTRAAQQPTVRATVALDRDGIGPLHVACTAAGVRRVTLLARREPASDSPAKTPAVASSAARAMLARAADALRRYLDGDCGAVLDVPLDLDSDVTPFQRRVLLALRTVPPGTTLTYGELALLAGSPGAARAVGGAMSRNPVPIFVPCHRVVASHGIGGFGGGLPCKRRLLALEGTPGFAGA